MALKLDFEEAMDLVWYEVLQEDRENFTPEFRDSIVRVVRKIREAI